MTDSELKRVIEQSTPLFLFFNRIHIKRHLTAMVKNGWIALESSPDGLKMHERVYSITEAGKSVFLKWLENTPDHRAPGIMEEFIAGLFLTAHPGLSGSSIRLRTFITETEKEIEHLSRLAPVVGDQGRTDFPRENFCRLASARFSSKIMKARLDWAKETLALINNQIKEKNKTI